MSDIDLAPSLNFPMPFFFPVPCFFHNSFKPSNFNFNFLLDCFHGQPLKVKLFVLCNMFNHFEIHVGVSIAIKT